MEETEMTIESQTQEQEQETAKYIEAIKELKSTTVSMEAYNQLKAENKTLLKSLVNGETIDNGSVQNEKTLDELRAELFRPKKELTNLEYVTKALELRERVIAETGEDPFVSRGHNVTPTADSYANAQKVAEIYKECIARADGDSEVFTAELMRRVQDNPLANYKNRR